MPPYEHSRQLAAEAAALPLPPRLQAAVTAVLPLNQQQGLAAVPTCQAAAPDCDSSGTSCSTLTLDSWLLLEGGTAGASEAPALTAAAMAAAPAAAAPGVAVGGLAQPAAPLPAAGAVLPPWLDGAVKRRRRDPCYMPAPFSGSAGAQLSIEEQLRERTHGLPANNAANARAVAAAAK